MDGKMFCFRCMVSDDRSGKNLFPPPHIGLYS